VTYVCMVTLDVFVYACVFQQAKQEADLTERRRAHVEKMHQIAQRAQHREALEQQSKVLSLQRDAERTAELETTQVRMNAIMAAITKDEHTRTEYEQILVDYYERGIVQFKSALAFVRSGLHDFPPVPLAPMAQPHPDMVAVEIGGGAAADDSMDADGPAAVTDVPVDVHVEAGVSAVAGTQATVNVAAADGGSMDAVAIAAVGDDMRNVGAAVGVGGPSDAVSHGAGTQVDSLVAALSDTDSQVDEYDPDAIYPVAPHSLASSTVPPNGGSASLHGSLFPGGEFLR
jgi:hypothetical protein